MRSLKQILDDPDAGWLEMLIDRVILLGVVAAGVSLMAVSFIALFAVIVN